MCLLGLGGIVMSDFAGCALLPLFACNCILGLFGIPTCAGAMYLASSTLLYRIAKIKETPLLNIILATIMTMVSIVLFTLMTWLWMNTSP